MKGRNYTRSGIAAVNKNENNTSPHFIVPDRRGNHASGGGGGGGSSRRSLVGKLAWGT